MRKMSRVAGVLILIAGVICIVCLIFGWDQAVDNPILLGQSIGLVIACAILGIGLLVVDI